MNIEWNKVTWYSQLLAIILFVGVFALGFYLGGRYEHAQQAAEDTLEGGMWLEEVTQGDDGSVCHENEMYLVVEKQRIGEVGSDFLIKFKAADNKQIECNYVVEEGDVHVEGIAEYLLALRRNFLIIDKGTAPPPRGLKIYDIANRGTVFSDQYSLPIDIRNSEIEYWATTDVRVTEENCPDVLQYEAAGLGSGIETRVILDLSTLSKKEMGEYRCAARQ